MGELIAQGAPKARILRQRFERWVLDQPRRLVWIIEGLGDPHQVSYRAILEQLEQVVLPSQRDGDRVARRQAELAAAPCVVIEEAQRREYDVGDRDDFERAQEEAERTIERFGSAVAPQPANESPQKHSGGDCHCKKNQKGGRQYSKEDRQVRRLSEVDAERSPQRTGAEIPHGKREQLRQLRQGTPVGAYGSEHYDERQEDEIDYQGPLRAVPVERRPFTES